MKGFDQVDFDGENGVKHDIKHIFLLSGKFDLKYISSMDILNFRLG
jgi:hypothetical protein